MKDLLERLEYTLESRDQQGIPDDWPSDIKKPKPIDVSRYVLGKVTDMQSYYSYKGGKAESWTIYRFSGGADIQSAKSMSDLMKKGLIRISSNRGSLELYFRNET